MRVRLRGINRVKKRLADGSIKIFFYHRATGARLEGEPHSPQFIASYAAAEKLVSDRLAGTLNNLIRDYTLSGEFGLLGKSTQSDYKRLLSYAESEFGDMPLAALDDRRVRNDFLAWRDRVAKERGPRGADYRLSALSAMLTWAEERTIIVQNHLKDFRRVYHNDRSGIIWLPEHIEPFMKVAPIEVQEALIAALHLGISEGDMLRLPKTAYSGERIQYRRGKSRRHGKPGRLISIKCTKTLRRMLDNLPKTDATTLLTDGNGAPWKMDAFKKAWRAARDAAGIKAKDADGKEVDLHWHDLRGTAVTMLSEAGVETQGIASITGHSLKHVEAILDQYLARTKHLADAAIVLFENARTTRFANRLQTGKPKLKVANRNG